MKHSHIYWNPATKEWFCTKCGRSSGLASVHDAHEKLDQYECHTRLTGKPYEMTLKTERSGSRFVIAKTAEGKPVIQLDLFHDTVSSLKSLTVGFEVLSGVTPQQMKTLVDSMNEMIIGVIVTAK